MSKLDPNTGLPELPEGFFWRIKVNRNEFINAPYKITIRARLWIFSVEEDYGFCYESNMIGQAESLAYSLRIRNLAGNKLNKSLLGDYPPKKFTGGTK